jgi:KaiC/GvpD/RAD55 family RecA-like ATPase
MAPRSYREKTGIYGLDSLIGGGFFPNTVIALIGDSGTGKTTFALQFLLKGLISGQHGLYLTLEESREKILRFSKLLGLSRLEEFAEEQKLWIVESRGTQIKDWIQNTLPSVVSEYSEFFKQGSRIVIDPLTPLLWELDSIREQRTVLSGMFNYFSQMGLTLVTIERYNGNSAAISKEQNVPVYLSDAAIHLQYLGLGSGYNRSLRILKLRGSEHGEDTYPLHIIQGLGLVVSVPEKKDEQESQDFSTEFEMAMEAVNRRSDPKSKEYLSTVLKIIKEKWKYGFSPASALKELLNDYKISYG